MTVSTEAAASSSADIKFCNSPSDNSGCVNPSHKLSNTLLIAMAYLGTPGRGGLGHDPPMAEWLQFFINYLLCYAGILVTNLPPRIVVLVLLVSDV